MIETDNRSMFFAIPEMPSLPGLHFRRFQGESDFPLMIDVLNGSKEADQADYSPTIEEMVNFFANMKNCDPYHDMLFAELNGQMIAYSRVSWGKETTGDYIYQLFGLVLPEWRHLGIGAAMLKSNETRLREISADHPAGAPKFFQSWVDETEREHNRLLKSAGYKPVRFFFEMTRPIDDPLPDTPMPEGLDVRRAEKHHYRQIAEASNEAFRDHWGHHTMTEVDYRRWINSPNFQPDLWKVAWDNDQVAGMVLNYIRKEENLEFNRKRGYTEDISVGRTWRKRGLAKSLIAQSILMFREMGMEETALGVDADNPNGALKLYKGLGYRTIKRTDVYRKPLQ
jgi:mycothiol synthase